MSSPASTAAKRRVPEALRKRTVASCDRCKQRRVRCHRSDKDSRSCSNCVDAGIACQMTLPRKQRVYGSVESLDARYRALDALVKVLFPDADVDDVEVLQNLVKENQFQRLHGHITKVASSGFDVLPIGAQSHLSTDTNNVARWPCNIDQTVQGTVVNLEEETCIPAPHGTAHYLGPASTFEFASAVRKLVGMCSRLMDNDHAQPDHPSQLRADFTNLRVSIAMEPRILAHPAAIVREEGDSSAQHEASPISAHTTPAHQSSTTSEQNPRSNSPYRRWLQALLPPRAVSDRLFTAFFERVHPNYVLFHRGTFQSKYESIWYHTSSYNYEAEPGWLCCLFMVLVFGAQALEPNHPDDAAQLQKRFLKYVRERFQHLALTASLANVQALLLLQLYEHNAGERNTAWILLGQATRMAIALGMHREGTSHNFDSIERNTRRMVWYTLYSFEQHTSLMLGRPTTIKALEVNVALPDEIIMDGNNYPKDYLQRASRLMDVASKVRHFATAASPYCFNPPMLNPLRNSALSLLQELDSWHNSLPVHLQSEYSFIDPRHNRAVTLLHILLQHLISVVCRPFLLLNVHSRIQSLLNAETRHPSQGDATDLSERSVHASHMVARLLSNLSDQSLLEPLVWIDFFYLYHALLIIALSFLPSVRLIVTTPSDTQQSYLNDVHFMIQECFTHKLAPTYHILAQVSIQLAKIAGLTSDEHASRHQTRAGSPVHEEHFNGTGSSLSDESTANAATFMPFAEPISNFNQYTSDTFWDFFNVHGVAEPFSTANPVAGFWPTPFSQPFG